MVNFQQNRRLLVRPNASRRLKMSRAKAQLRHSQIQKNPNSDPSLSLVVPISKKAMKKLEKRRRTLQRLNSATQNDTEVQEQKSKTKTKPKSKTKQMEDADDE